MMDSDTLHQNALDGCYSGQIPINFIEDRDGILKNGSNFLLLIFGSQIVFCDYRFRE